MSEEKINRVDLEMKASAELNSDVAQELMVPDPNESDAEASIKEHTKNDDDGDS